MLCCCLLCRIITGENSVFSHPGENLSFKIIYLTPKQSIKVMIHSRRFFERTIKIETWTALFEFCFSWFSTILNSMAFSGNLGWDTWCMITEGFPHFCEMIAPFSKGHRKIKKPQIELDCVTWPLEFKNNSFFKNNLWLLKCFKSCFRAVFSCYLVFSVINGKQAFQFTSW